MAVLLDRVVVDLESSKGPNQYIGLLGETFHDPYIPNALKKAQDHAGRNTKKGFVASLPQLLHGISVSPDGIETLKQVYYTPLSEEDVGKSPDGNDVFIEVHGGGILHYPARIEHANNPNQSLLEGAAKFYDDEIKNLLGGKLPDGTEIPVYSFDDLKGGIANLPMRYAIVRDLDRVKKSRSGYHNIEDLYNNELFIMRAGSVEQAARILDKLKERYQEFGNRHSLNNVDPYQPQGRLLLLNQGNFGISDVGLYYGNFVSVSPEALEAFLNSTRKASLESRVRTALERP